MKLPWNKKYLQISFHIIITIVIIYILSLLIKNIYDVQRIFFLLFNKIISILGPLFIALIFSYLIDPVVDFFQEKYDKIFPPKNKSNKSSKFKMRKRGTIVTYITILLILIILGNIVAKKIGSTDINALVLSFNEYIQGFSDMFVLLKVKLAEFGMLENVDGVLQGWINGATLFIKGIALSVADSVTKAGSWILNLFIGLTVAFYFLVEKEKILYYCKDILYTFLEEKKASKIASICHDINGVFSGYIGGQITDAIIMTILIGVALSFVRIPYAVAIGVISGFSNLIPYVGAIVAFILSVSVGLLSGTPIKALYAAIIVVLLQQIDGIFIVPKVVGKSVELHPALVLLSLSIFGAIFGIFGMIVAVPCTALIKLFVLRLYRRKKKDNQA